MNIPVNSSKIHLISVEITGILVNFVFHWNFSEICKKYFWEWTFSGVYFWPENHHFRVIWSEMIENDHFLTKKCIFWGLFTRKNHIWYFQLLPVVTSDLKLPVETSSKIYWKWLDATNSLDFSGCYATSTGFSNLAASHFKNEMMNVSWRRTWRHM